MSYDDASQPGPVGPVCEPEELAGPIGPAGGYITGPIGPTGPIGAGGHPVGICGPATASNATSNPAAVNAPVITIPAHTVWINVPIISQWTIVPDLDDVELAPVEKKDIGSGSGCNCSKCKDFYPYAEVSKDKEFVCYGCRIWNEES